jgi:hypothetical protein
MVARDFEWLAKPEKPLTAKHAKNPAKFAKKPVVTN